MHTVGRSCLLSASTTFYADAAFAWVAFLFYSIFPIHDIGLNFRIDPKARPGQIIKAVESKPDNIHNTNNKNIEGAS
jgi:hypothetical protein